MARRLVVPPASEPLTLEEAKLHLRVDHDLEDAAILRLIRSAREAAEEATSRTLLPTTWSLRLERWPAPECVDGRLVREIRIEDALLSVVSVSYRDADGVVQVLDPSAYDVDEGPPGRLRPAHSHDWPRVRPGLGAVEVVYTAGYASAELVPASLKDWMLLHVGTHYENREGVVPGVSVAELPGLDGLLSPARWGGYP
ncbi:head-tail connector protein [Paludisphaera sp.]|uniref:head-tail connector protein n=1 Tax=Paludisphaera sp. TaxID=2017432 RepID=UPI00301C12FA